MKLIGLTGGAGSGKSTVANMFRDLGAVIVDADEATHAVYAPGTPGFDEIVREFGTEFVRDGQIDRTKLGDLIFRDPDARWRLNAIVHPLVREWMASKTAEAAESGATVVIHDVPLLFENGMQDFYSPVILVYANPGTQLARLLEDRGLSLVRANQMLASQMSIDEKRQLADFIIENGGSLHETRAQVEKVWRQISS